MDIPIDCLSHIGKFLDIPLQYSTLDNPGLHYLLFKLRQCNHILTEKYCSIFDQPTITGIVTVNRIRIRIDYHSVDHMSESFLSWLENELLRIKNIDIKTDNDISQIVFLWKDCYLGSLCSSHQGNVDPNMLNCEQHKVCLLLLINQMMSMNSYLSLFDLFFDLFTKNMRGDNETHFFPFLIKKISKMNNSLFEPLFVKIFDALYSKHTYLRFQYFTNILEVVKERPFSSICAKKMSFLIISERNGFYVDRSGFAQYLRDCPDQTYSIGYYNYLTPKRGYK